MPRERFRPEPFEPSWLERSLNRYLFAGVVFMVALIVGFAGYRAREPSLRADACAPSALTTRRSAAGCSRPAARSAMVRTRPVVARPPP